MSLYSDFKNAKRDNTKLLAILVDPDKVDYDGIGSLAQNIKESPATHIFVGGSLVLSNRVDDLVIALQKCGIPIIIFPGNPSQISHHASGILFLSLISGTNPDFLIGHQIAAAPILKKSKLEVIPTGYILIESGAMTAVSEVSRTPPIDRTDSAKIVATAQAGELLGHQLIYLEAGSGAKHAVPTEVIVKVSTGIDIPLIVGGGIRSLSGIQQAYDSGADMVVIGTAFEDNHQFFKA